MAEGRTQLIAKLIYLVCYAAPAVNGTLTEADAPQILEELLPAQLLGVKLGLPDRDVEAIILRYPDARDRLYHIIIEFLRQVEPRPTWRVIVEALRSPTVGLPDLAKKLEEVHFPDSISTSDVVAEPKGKWPSSPLKAD